MVVGIIGTTQGGTSAVAAVVKSLGVPLEGLDRCLDDAALFGPVEIPQEVIADRNQKHPHWAWKYPMAYSKDLDFTDRFIVVWRDPVARAVHKRDFNAPNPVIFKEWFEITNTFLEIPQPVLHVSYEKLLVYPQKSVQTIADYLNVAVNPQAVAAINQKAGYDANKVV